MGPLRRRSGMMSPEISHNRLAWDSYSRNCLVVSYQKEKMHMYGIRMLNPKVVKCIDLTCADSIGQTREYG